MRRTIALAALAALLPSVGAPADPAASVFPAGWRQGWARSIEGRKLSYRWGYPGYAVSLLCRAVDPTWAIEWEGEAPPAAGPDETVTYVWHVGLNSRRVAPPLRAAARRSTAPDVRHRRRRRERHLDDRGERRRAPPLPDDADRQLRRALRLHGPDPRPAAARGRTATLPHRARGRGEPGLRARLRGAGHGMGEARCRGGGPLGRAAAAHRGRQPPRPRRAREREGRGTGGPPGRARDRPLPHRHRRARGRHGVGPGRDRSGGSDRPGRDGGPPPGRGPRVPPRAALARGHRLLGPAAGGRAQAVAEPARRARALPEDEGPAPRGAVPLAGRGPLGGGELPRPGERDGAARLRRGGEARRPRAARQPHERPDRSLPPRGARPVDGRVATPEEALRHRGEPGRDAHGHPRPRLAHGDGTGAGRRALLLERAELHAELRARPAATGSAPRSWSRATGPSGGFRRRAASGS